MDRRSFLRSSGVVAGIAIAGCTTDGDGGGDGGDGGDGAGGDGGGNGSDGNGGGNGGGGETISGSEYPAVDEWLTESEVGGADDSYDGSIVDARGSDSPTVDVGAEGNDGAYAFGPSAIAVSPGTEVTWVWTGEGETHNVVAAPDDQIGESDFEFRSGDPVADEGTEYTQTFDETGVALYHCSPHLALGMKGAVVVAEE